MKKIPTPKEYRRSIEVIMRENPEMKAKDIFLEQAYEEACYDLWVIERDKKYLEIIDRLTRVKYYKLKYSGSSDLMMVLEITKAYLSSDNTIYFDAIETKISKQCSPLGEPTGINIETLRRVTYKKYDNYFEGCEIFILNKKEYDSIINYINNIY